MAATIAARLRRSRRVESINDEGTNGIWAYLRPGWRCPAADTHSCHEWSWEELERAVRLAVPCRCDECLKSQVSN